MADMGTIAITNIENIDIPTKVLICGCGNCCIAFLDITEKHGRLQLTRPQFWLCCSRKNIMAAQDPSYRPLFLTQLVSCHGLHHDTITDPFV